MFRTAYDTHHSCLEKHLRIVQSLFPALMHEFCYSLYSHANSAKTYLSALSAILSVSLAAFHLHSIHRLE